MLIIYSFSSCIAQASTTLTEELNELRQNLTELTIAYKELCQELGHLSRHVAFHEKALQHIAQYGHGHVSSNDVHSHVHENKHGNETASGHHEGHHEHSNDTSINDHHHQHHHRHYDHHHHHPSNRTNTKENEIQVSWPLI